MLSFERTIGVCKDYLFPIHCLGCGCEGIWVCTPCIRMIDVTGVTFCPVCNVLNDTGTPCRGCESESAVAVSQAVGRLSDVTPLRAMIEHLKYRYVEGVLPAIGEIISMFFAHTSLEEVDLLIPVPLHPRRFRERGFNQSEYICQFIAEAVELPLSLDLVSRSRYTKPQVRQGRASRIRNLTGAFSVENNEKISGKDILLVDDVYTSGATMQSLARTLRESGAGRISVCTLAKG